MKAFWITPKGKTIELTGKHIEAIRTNAATFGLTEQGIKETYERFGEHIGQEAKARELIIKNLIHKGYIRIREYKRFGWSVNVNRVTHQIERKLQDWAFDQIKAGSDRYAEVKIDSPNGINILTLADIAQGKGFK